MIFNSKAVGSSDDPVVGVHNGKRSRGFGQEDVAMRQVDPGRLLREAAKLPVVEVEGGLGAVLRGQVLGSQGQVGDSKVQVAVATVGEAVRARAGVVREAVSIHDVLFGDVEVERG